MAVTFPTLKYKLPKAPPAYNLASGLGLGLKAITEGYDVAQKQHLGEAQLKRLLEKDQEDSRLKQAQLLKELEDLNIRRTEARRKAEADEAKRQQETDVTETTADLWEALATRGPSTVTPGKTTDTPGEPGGAVTEPPTETMGNYPSTREAMGTLFGKRKGKRTAVDPKMADELFKMILKESEGPDYTKVLPNVDKLNVEATGPLAKWLSGMGTSVKPPEPKKPSLTPAVQTLIAAQTDPAVKAAVEEEEARDRAKKQFSATLETKEAPTRALAVQQALAPGKEVEAERAQDRERRNAGLIAAAKDAGTKSRLVKSASGLLTDIEGLAQNPNVDLKRITGGLAPYINEMSQKDHIAYVPLPGFLTKHAVKAVGRPLTDEENELLASINDYADRILRIRSGAQINIVELNRLNNFIFTAADNPQTFMAKLRRERHLMDRELTLLNEAMGGVTPEQARAELKRRGVIP